MMTERVTVKTVMCTLNEYTRTMAFGQNALLMHSIFPTCLLPEIMGKWYIARWLSEITVTEWTKSPNFAWSFFSTYSTVLA